MKNNLKKETTTKNIYEQLQTNTPKNMSCLRTEVEQHKTGNIAM